ncbi:MULTISPECIES: 23S rRNA pseudouridine(2605) synthase RluB [unclassified Wenzhouxiangella]|uniref:23S rRNA pseudouridine(2605) synthase RluB n=1 Tax=unclassified Wenzhouxiangella TaxID=2613841 RepID=UPI000E32B0F3|nr:MULTISPECIES: pseudouridine synthase [unclassified Wenzhouxiangella]RFF27986.1 pseudouridine synthase [Wenzhouxiangella sp. 15181]RFP68573.1 pseudouridine synthase [Wenzhouxiangella sp. 15190]
MNRQHSRKKARAEKPKASGEKLTESGATERLQKILARAGLGSRRKLEARIEAGEIRVDGRIAELGATVGDGSLVELDGRRFRITSRPAEHRTLIYNKPEGEVTTRNDPEGRRTVFDRLPGLQQGRWIAIGRLDINTAGLLVLTTDGELANRMMHPSGQVDREYLCRVRGSVSEEQIEQLLSGVQLDDGPARFSDIVAGEVTGGHSWYTVALMEGRYREVRRLWEAVGAQVARLKRVRFGPVFLPSRVKSGQYEELSPADHRVLREDVGLSSINVELMAEEVSSSR